jgi:hypothetical protein
MKLFWQRQQTLGSSWLRISATALLPFLVQHCLQVEDIALEPVDLGVLISNAFPHTFNYVMHAEAMVTLEPVTTPGVGLVELIGVELRHADLPEEQLRHLLPR